MKIIKKANDTVLRLLPHREAQMPENVRFSRFVLREETEEGILLFDTLTCALLFLTRAEEGSRETADALWQHRFLIPADADETRWAREVRTMMKLTVPMDRVITSYTVLTTSECNAHCWYCYENGRRRYPMSMETADKAAEYIAAHSGGKKVKLSWFGGEPLYNRAVIDRITERLAERGIPFSSSMISNGYLFDRETVGHAVEQWKLRKVQITLDGTEEVYNRIKAYDTRDGGSPFARVLSNMDLLLGAGVSVAVRLNVGEDNADDLCALVGVLRERFSKKTELYVYSHILFQFEGEENEAAYRSLCEKKKRLDRLIAAASFGEAPDDSDPGTQGASEKPSRLPDCIRLTACMADCGRARVITPDGRMTLCEHFYDSEIIGSLENGDTEPERIRAWRKPITETERCRTCPVYPQCVKLEKCPSGRIPFGCGEDTEQSIRAAMKKEYYGNPGKE